LGLGLATFSGILFADYFPFPSSLGLLLFGSLLIGALGGIRGFLFPAVATGFAVIHIWQTTESSGFQCREWCGDEPRLVKLVGTLSDEPVSRASGSRFLMEIEHLEIPDLEITRKHLKPGLRFLCFASEGTFHYGERVELQGILSLPQAPHNPGEFPYRDWLRRKGIYQTLHILHATPLSSPSSHGIFYGMHRLRDFVADLLQAGISDSPEEAALIRGMTLGEYKGEEDIQNAFRRTGVYHLFSVSGLHVAMVGLIVSILSRPLGRRTSLLLSFGAIILYAAITGFRPAGVRAACMGSLIFGGLAFELRPHSINSLACAFTLLLATNTQLLFDAGFQLSFLVVAGILIGAPFLQRGLNRFFLTDPFIPKSLWTHRRRMFHAAYGHISSALSVSLAAWLASFIFIASAFHLISWISPVANLFAAPLAFGMLALALISILTGSFLPWFAEIFNQTNWLCASILIWGIQQFATIPYGWTRAGESPPRQSVEWTILDMDRGGASLMRTPHQSFLIDCGDERSVSRTLRPFLESKGLPALDGILMTHADASHTGGLASVLNAFPTHRIGNHANDARLTQWVRQQATDPSSHHVLLTAGDVWKLENGESDVQIKILHPEKDFPATIADDRALVFLATIQGQRILHLSDAGPRTLSQLALHHPRLQADVVVMGRHQNGTFPSPTQLARLGVRAVITSVAHFPSTEMLDLSWANEIRRLGMVLFRQDETGAVICRFSKNKFRIDSFLGKMAYEERHYE